MKTFIITLFFVSFSFLSMAQKVGINQPLPQQALDVNGKVQVGNDAATPTAGAIRFNTATNDHEGFDGTTWKSFTVQKSSGLPTNPVSLYGFEVIGPGTRSSMIFYRDDDGSGYTTVPVGKYVIITMVAIESNNLGTSGTANVNVGPSTILDDYPNLSRGLFFHVDRLSPQIFTAGAAPLITLRAGEYLSVNNDYISGYNIGFRFRGFLVDDLKY